MRISSQNMSAMLLHNLRQNDVQVNKLVEQTYRGKAVLVPSDNPIASTRLVQLQREQSAITQYQSNITRLSGSLLIQESYIKSFGDTLGIIKDKLLLANNGSNSGKDIQSYGQELGALLDTLAEGLNAKNENGQYIFGGTKNDIDAVVYDPSVKTYRFQGNTGERQTTVGNGITITENTDVSHVFSENGSDLSLLNDLKALSEKMKDPGIPVVADYQKELSDALSKVDQAADKNAALMTDLGGRQNRLSLLEETHAGVKIANEAIIDDLSRADPAEIYTKLGRYIQTIQASNTVYGKISHLSIFDVI